MALSPQLAALHARLARHVPGAHLPTPLGEAGVRHLVRRLTWGEAPGLVEEVRRDPQAWFEAQLDPARLDDAACDGYAARFTKVRRPITEVRSSGTFGNWDTMFELGMLTVARYTWSRRQLLEVVCDFWSNHLNVTCPSSDVWDNRHHYDAAVIRQHALGSFEDMLVASAKHPAMLRYLDNASSTKKAPNENYAREVMELHTVGVDAGYGEAGVRAAARVFTGLTVDSKTGTYTYDANRHDTSAATVLDWSTPAHSAAEGEAVATDLLRHLARHPATATAIARKLAIRFVADTPPSSLVTRLAGVYRSSGTQIVPVLRALFTSDEFWTSTGQKTRRPLEGFLAAVRTTGAMPGPDGWGGIDDLYWQTREVGHWPLAWAPPNGYPDVAAAWRSAGSTMNRWNATTAIAHGWWPNTFVRPAATSVLPSPLPTTFGGLIDALVQRLLGRAPTTTERAALLAFTEHGAGDALKANDQWVGWRLNSVVATILNSPGHMER
ncbi:Uncharacterized conserved protein, DUF1800 family [Quadrisphaera granulorum]|uniref:Uncharacterized protein (DUF1800 family) n=1 Tax=Quadrisphaera granulorum TaxID=317664 RepID=A0A316A559_9ACTN|nr:DUF1800 domain-containing protein [Quadrisphaera granulorum]PWJ53031.1 uncharacterized protein (DUF1800 family) [Quadrisphaera granulorum]SZE97196.1 Uncharacterized conserved protein, DUF1800 family [Quadrisphaera granulorum]